MAKKFAVLPCNGLDKPAGCVAREAALKITGSSDSELICPVFYRVSDTRYNKIAGEMPLLVIDGCSTRCASKLAADKGLKIAAKVTVAEEAKKRGVELGKSLHLDAAGLELAGALAEELLREEQKEDTAREDLFAGIVYDYEVYKKDKFIFRVPKGDFYFNENDCWVYIIGNKARVGVTDYVQQSLSDIMFFTPPVVGAEIEQFGELGTIESGKAVFEVVCPVSGRVTAVNEDIISAPELINENPYEKGWIAELELTDPDGDKEFLLDFDGYFSYLKKKVDEFEI
jgi:glycine cleavage system H protein